MKLSEKAVLMRFSAGMVGKHRKDKKVTSEVKSEKNIGAGNWVKDLWPDGALDAIQAKQSEARGYHDEVTFPFGVKADADDSGDGEKSKKAPSIAGILPAAMIQEYGDTMRMFKGQMDKLVDDFIVKGDEWIAWAVSEHNGSFDPKNYPGCWKDCTGSVILDKSVWSVKMRKAFYMTAQPLPVPDSEQFSASVSSLLGVDAQSVDLQVADAALEAQRELLKRMIEPVQHMASKLAGQTCYCRSCKGKPSLTANFKDSLIDNIVEIAALVPKLNLSGDPAIDAFGQAMKALTRYTPDALRDSDVTRKEAAEKAGDVLKRLSGYSL
jgi:hypothetical protein